MRRIIITGAAGLVGQNLVARLKRRADLVVIGIDKHPGNVSLFRQVHPEISIVEADLAKPGEWAELFAGADAVVINQAQIGGLNEQEFWRNNVAATENILSTIQMHGVPYFAGISSSVVNSKADDFYTRTKAAQENLFDASTVPHCVLRPTLMFGWFDRKHLGWLRRFMERMPLFPIPGDGNYKRQPLYVGDFVSIIASAMERHATGTFDISGLETISYGELIRTIHDIVKPRAKIVHIPYHAFWALLWIYGRLDRNPPFTTQQLEALVIPETFPIIDWPALFGVEATPLRRALEETFLDTAYGKIVLEF
jgi:nucleoside-diphosphate-sugar epimerase